ncbi:RNA polymerase sigma factor [Chitinophaga horti]|uniref:RNA polymerase sigma factor n=1 Tax=Chitinophaga horti TaxID=2920382 RepID=A0ABY6J8Y5_9BACT|nr:RNA polymerase sigma factor [Chitinophaga horti]UYQ95950.1 RNA polymerase sigma factor [Chitinophaga horti]
MDDQYVARVLAGDTDAYRYFLRTYQDMAFSLAMSILKDEFLAEEAAQDAFVKAFASLGSFAGKSSFKTWFYRIVLNAAFAKRKKQQKEWIEFQAGYDEELADDDAMAKMSEDEQAWLVNEGLKRLTEKEAVVLRLFYLEDEPIKSVSDITGWSEANVKVILHRARKNMLSVFKKLLKHE